MRDETIIWDKGTEFIFKIKNFNEQVNFLRKNNSKLIIGVVGSSDSGKLELSIELLRSIKNMQSYEIIDNMIENGVYFNPYKLVQEENQCFIITQSQFILRNSLSNQVKQLENILSIKNYDIIFFLVPSLNHIPSHFIIDYFDYIIRSDFYNRDEKKIYYNILYNAKGIIENKSDSEFKSEETIYELVTLFKDQFKDISDETIETSKNFRIKSAERIYSDNNIFINNYKKK